MSPQIALYIAMTLARIVAFWAWTQSHPMRRRFRHAAIVLGVALLAWWFPLGLWILVWILIGVGLAARNAPEDIAQDA